MLNGVGRCFTESEESGLAKGLGFSTEKISEICNVRSITEPFLNDIP